MGYIVINIYEYLFKKKQIMNLTDKINMKLICTSS